ncbi:MAG TPA: D-arabinono-1,4-lactone oxidase [Blastocatellia bacterium]
MQKHSWSNWSGSVSCNPKEIVYPQRLDELTDLVVETGRIGRHIRVAGAGHSFTRLVESEDIIVSLDRLSGIVSADETQSRATVWAGTHLKDLGESLFKVGLAQENLGDIDTQSIAGAVSTGTHGTGVRFGSIATQVEGLTLLTGAGDIIHCSPDENPELFKAAQVSFGALGIIVQVTLRLEPTYRLRRESRRATLNECLTNLEQLKASNRNFEFFWFPYSEYCQLKTLNVTTDAATPVSKFNLLMENRVFSALSECCRIFPRISPSVSRLSGRLIPSVSEVNFGHRIFPTPRLVRFQEMEYNVPAEEFVDTLLEIRECINCQRFNVHFPVECRFVRGDDIWLSPASGRDSAYLAVHMYKGMPYREYFDALEPIFQRHQGRPHWGKMHTMPSTQLASSYPRWDDFRRLRAELDPKGVLLNPYLAGMLGMADSSAQNASVVS